MCPCDEAVLTLSASVLSTTELILLMLLKGRIPFSAAWCAV